MGTLYMIATPIGNLEDITVRAAKILTEIGIVVCEDTRHSGMLLEHLRNSYLQNPLLANKPRLISFFDDNEEKRIPEIIGLLSSGHDIALVSDAGTPSISDPGFTIVRECITKGISVIAIPGASSVTVALTISGLPTDKYFFIGYLPKKKGNAKKLLEKIHTMQEIVAMTIICFVSPHRLINDLMGIKQIYGDITIVVCRELTKLHEEVIRGTVNTILAVYEHKPPRGEYVLLWHGESSLKKEKSVVPDEQASH